jgi:hypothetical protein
VFEHGRLLKLSPDARLHDLGLAHLDQVGAPAEPRGAGIGPRLPGNHIHHRRLTGAIRPDDAAQLAGLDVERQRVKRFEAVEANRQLLEI